jgi:hypothetical protein
MHNKNVKTIHNCSLMCCLGRAPNLVSKGNHRYWWFENRVLRRIFGTEEEQVTGGWRNLNNEELHIIMLGCSYQGERD